MKYNAPYGVSDPNAPYINGNPATGTMGSIPPAESIEHPQREIVNLIADAAAVTPVATDLHQMGKSIQSGKINYGVDIGVVNALIVPLVPTPDAYYDGMQCRFKAKYAPTAATTLDAGRGARSVVKSGGAPLAGSEWSVGDHVTVTYDAASSHWQLPPSSYAMLYATKDYYVSNAGNDSNDGLTAGTPFATLQRAQNTVNLFNLNGYSVNIHVTDGTYNSVYCGIINGTGTVNYIGNIGNPAACVIQSGTGPAFQATGALYTLRGFKVTSTGHASGNTGIGVYSTGGGQVQVFDVEVGYCIDHQFCADGGGQIGISGPVTVTGSAGGAHVLAQNGSFISSPYPNQTPLNITAAVNMIVWITANGSGITAMRYSPMLGAGNVNAKKYDAFGNGVINSILSGVNYYPGNSPGTLSSGGQYI